MFKVIAFVVLFITYVSYSSWVYTGATSDAGTMNELEQSGKKLWQKHNCTSCHQIFGLGGYLGPELTTVISDPNKGEAFARVFLQNGGTRMPNFHFNPEEINDLIAYLKYIDSNAFTYKTPPIKHEHKP